MSATNLVIKLREANRRIKELEQESARLTRNNVQSNVALNDANRRIADLERIIGESTPKTKLYMTTEYGGGFNVDTEENYNKTNPAERMLVYTNDWN